MRSDQHVSGSDLQTPCSENGQWSSKASSKIRELIAQRLFGSRVAASLELTPRHCDALAQLALDGLAQGGYILARKAEPECNICDRPLHDHTATCPANPANATASGSFVKMVDPYHPRLP